MMSKNQIAGLIVVVFLIGAGYFVMSGRPSSPPPMAPVPAVETPVVTEKTDGDATSTEMGTVVSSTEAGTAAEPPKSRVVVYTMADILAHATPESCWTTVNGSVYDITTWAARHPGGPGPIGRLCGTDGTKSFERKHGNSKKANAMLVLLKIGTLTN